MKMLSEAGEPAFVKAVTFTLWKLHYDTAIYTDHWESFRLFLKCLS